VRVCDSILELREGRCRLTQRIWSEQYMFKTKPKRTVTAYFMLVECLTAK